MFSSPPVRALLPNGIRRVSRWIFNCYLIEDGGAGAPVVVDPGLPSLAKAVLWELTHHLGRAPSDVCTITATHLHSDHVGGMGPLHAASEARVILPGQAGSYMRGEAPRPLGLGELREFRPFVGQQPFDAGALVEAIKGMGDGVGGGYFSLSAPIHGLARDGERLHGAPDWEVIATPGHSDCSSCYWNSKTRTLLSGDTVLTLDGRAYFNPERLDPEALDRTEERLRQLPVEHLLPGHGLPIHGRDASLLMGEALSHTHRHHSRTAAGTLARWCRAG